MDINITPKTLTGRIDAVPSKSVLHRALICAALSEGKSRIGNIVLSDDIMATAGALKALGAKVIFQENAIIVEGIKKSLKGLQSEAIRINCGESGSTLRFMIPVTSALGVNAVFIGEGKLPKRPLQTYLTALSENGIHLSHPVDANLPLVIEGRLKSGHYTIPGSVSSQYITGLLLALPICDGDSTITIEEPFESKGYVDITLSVMNSFGISIEEQPGCYKIQGNQTYLPAQYTVEGDWSQAAVWLCAGALGGSVTVNGMDPASKQGDAAVVDILRKFGAAVELLEDGGVRASGGELTGSLVNAAQIPDIIPVLSVVAAFAKGKTEITNAGRLRFKESDRLQATAEVLALLGADIKVDCDSLIIKGKDQLIGGTANGYNDHRIVMALSAAACGCKEPVTILGSDCIRKSYPHFFEDYRKLGGEANGIHIR